MSLLNKVLLIGMLGSACLAAADFALRDGDTVVFYGDSITDQRLYTTYVENYVLTRYPAMHVRFIHSGWGGDRVTGGGGGPIDLRLQRDIIAYKPTVLTIMLGMNDGSYRAYDPAVFKTFADGYKYIVDTVKAALPGIRITAIVPSPYDDATRAPLFEGGYNAVLLRYGQYIRELAKSEGIATADLNTGVVTALRAAASADPLQAQKLIPDRVHPGAAGHLLMAEALLTSWNAPALVSDIEINAAERSSQGSVGAEVTNVQRTDQGISWIETESALPFPVDWKDPLVKLAADSSDFVAALDREELRVRGLAPGQYALSIDGTAVGTFSAEALRSGVNLALLPTPMLTQAQDVSQLTKAHNDLHFVRWRTVQVPLAKYGPTGLPAAMSSLDALEEEVVAAQRAAAVPKEHHFALMAQ